MLIGARLGITYDDAVAAKIGCSSLLSSKGVSVCTILNDR
jgi:hypothetical protein